MSEEEIRSSNCDDGLMAPPSRVRHAGRTSPLHGTLILTLTLMLILVAGTFCWIAMSHDGVSQWLHSAPGSPAGAPPSTATASVNTPGVEPVRYLEVTADQAREINAAVPFSARRNPAAKPFSDVLQERDAALALDCLAAAAWYEAGDDTIGEQAVIQVVLNRLRHPSFPKTVCGVVFQGSERTTGCQFTFTCDGALARTPSAVSWHQARGLALIALNGGVYAPVGLSTHYHADWVVPYWSASLEKTAAVHSHLFFRWRGRAGDPTAFLMPHVGAEAAQPKLARQSSAHAAALAIASSSAVTDQPPTPADTDGATALVPAASPTAVRGSLVLNRDRDTNTFTMEVEREAFAGDLALAALQLCGEQANRCKVFGVLGDTMPTDGRVVSGTSGEIAFYYARDPSRGFERVLWNCQVWKRRNADECIGIRYQLE